MGLRPCSISGTGEDIVNMGVWGGGLKGPRDLEGHLKTFGFVLCVMGNRPRSLRKSHAAEHILTGSLVHWGGARRQCRETS